MIDEIYFNAELFIPSCRLTVSADYTRPAELPVAKSLVKNNS